MAWQPLIGADAEIHPVPLPGRGSRLADPPETNFEKLCDRAFSEIRSPAREPFYCMGSSMGGWMAYEIALRFEHIGVLPSGVIMLSSPMPNARQQLPELDNPETVVTDIIGINPIFEEVVQYPELLELILPTMQADFRMCNAYEPSAGNMVNIPILGFAGTDDPLVTPDAMLGWEALTTAVFDLTVVSGAHDLHERPTAAMVDRVSSFLAAPHGSMVERDVCSWHHQATPE